MFPASSPAGSPGAGIPGPRESLVALRERITGKAPRTGLPIANVRQAVAARPVAHGKFLFIGAEKFWIRGVTYGTFAPDANGFPFPAPDQVERDFGRMAARGFNTVRVYTPPERWLLDLASTCGLRVIVGLPWEQHIAIFEHRGRAAAIAVGIGDSVRANAGHPAILCYAIGNEIPSAIVRWHGRRRIERFLHRLYDVVKREDPAALVTYVNFPTTEYLRLPFLDFFSFNVYLESRDKLEAYLARLQNLAGEKPLLMAEIGLDSRRNGVDGQAESLRWQIQASFAAGCVGATVFAWTDEWHRGGHDIDDWDFGLTTRERSPKPALETVAAALLEAPFPSGIRWPRISVVVASFNGARTLRDTLEGLKRLRYPDFEAIVVNDGSTDATASIAAEYDVKLISTPNNGLSHARNLGWQAATGEIIAYIDDDAWPDPHWLHYLAYRFMTGNWVGVGGPNIAPAGDGAVADCIANAPGGPVHVLISDTEAEHIPGCNMAFRRDALAAIGGFDPRYRSAGDDVDVCWRLQERGGRIGFHAGAMDWHHRRNSVAMYWRQQKGYGKAEALLEDKWPERYTPVGHLTWAGRLYGRGFALPITFRRAQIYGGVWGTAGYQSLYDPAPLSLLWLPLMPEWYLVIGALAGLAVLGLSWSPLLWIAPLLVLAISAPIAQAALAAYRAQFPVPPKSFGQRVQRRSLTFLLHLMQPVARLIGRLQHGLTPWRRRQLLTMKVTPTERTFWSETWKAPEQWIAELESALRRDGAIVVHGGNWDQWDLSIRGGLLGSLDALITVEEHGSGRQLLRFRTHARVPPVAAAGVVVLALGTVLAALDAAWPAAISLAALSAAIAIAADGNCDIARQYWKAAVQKVKQAASAQAPQSPPSNDGV